MALTISVQLQPSLGNGVITTAPFAGLTVNKLLAIANNVYGGCSPQYSLSQLNTILSAINEAYDEGRTSNLLSCPPACTLALPAPSSITGVSCFGGNTGGFTVAATGGTNNMYAIASVSSTGVVGTYGTAQTSGTFSNLAAGTYSVRVTSGNCTATRLVTISQPLAALSISTAATTPATCLTGGSITVTAAGGTGPYTYQLGTGAIGASNVFGDLAPGAYTVTVRDASGCSVTRTSVTILGAPAIISLTSSQQVNVNCSGAANGSVRLSATGGTAPYTYTLDGLATQTSNDGVTFSNLAAGTYAISVRDAKGCTATGTAVVISQPNLLGVTFSNVVNATCTTATGSAMLTATGGTGPFTFTLTRGTQVLPLTTTGDARSVTFTGLAPGVYSVLVTDARGCTASCAAIQISSIFANIVVTSTPVDVSCFGNNTGSFTLTPSGGAAPYTYSVNGSFFGSSNTFGGLIAGTYNATVKDANGCLGTTTVTIGQSARLLVTFSNVVNATCTTSTGSATLSASGGTGGYTYTLTMGTTVRTIVDGASATFTNLAPGTYTVLVTDARGCTATCAAIQINSIFANILVATTQQNVNCLGTNTGSFVITATGGAEPYQFSVNGLPFAEFNGFRNLVAGVYIVTVRDRNGCTGTTSVTITQPVTALAIATAVPNNAICTAANGSITVTATGGAGGYTYALGSGAFGTGNVFSGLAAGTYTVSVQDAARCTVTRSNVTILGAPSPIVLSSVPSPVRCNGEANGSVQLSAAGGAGPFTFTLDGRQPNGTGTFVNLAAGTYPVSVTGAFGCVATGSVTITQPARLVVTFSNVVNATCTTSTGSVRLSASGGTAPYTYRLDGLPTQTSSDGVTFSGLAPGTYSVLVTDARGCTATCAAIQINSIFAIISLTSSQQVNVSCFGSGNGSVRLTATGGTAPFTYTLDGLTPNSTGIFAGLAPGTYPISVRDANGCTATGTSVVITQPAALAASFSNTPISCFGGTSTVTRSISGGTPPYQLSVNGSAFELIPSQGSIAIPAGTYNRVIRDANGCTISQQVVITQPAQVVASVNTPIINCFGGTTTLTASATGGTGAYQFAVNGGAFASASSFTLGTGTYSIVARDANGCLSAAVTRVIGQPARLVVTLSNLVNGNCTTATGSATLTASGGTAPYTYTLTSGTTVRTIVGGASATFTNLASGIYAVLVTDARGCTATCAAVQIRGIFSTILLTSRQVNVSCFGSNSGSFSVFVSGGRAPYRVSVNNSRFVRFNTFINLFAGTYNVRVRDANGCTATTQVVILQPRTPLAIATTVVGSATCIGANGSITVNAAGGTAPYRFALNGGAFGTGNVFGGLAAGTYSVSVRDANGCSTTRSNITILGTPGNLTVTFSNLVNATCTTSTGSVMLSASGGTGGYTYTLTSGTTVRTIVDGPSATFTNLAPGTYTVLVTDARGCTASCAAIQVIGVNGLLSLTSAVTNASCFGTATGSVRLSAAGGTAPFTFTLGGRAANGTGVFNDLAAGTYPVSVSNSFGCSATGFVTVGQPAALGLIYSVPATCGQVGVSTAGGTGPYVYTLRNAAGSLVGTSPSVAGGFTFTNLGTNVYTVSVLDANGCFQVCPFSVSITGCPVPCNLALTAGNVTATGVQCFGSNTGSIRATASGSGTDAIRYELVGTGNTSGFTSGVFTGLTGGTYTVRATAGSACTATVTGIIVSQPAARMSLIYGIPGSCGQLTLTAIGGTGPYLYSLYSNTGLFRTATVTASGSFTFVGLPTGTYTGYVVDRNGCTMACLFGVNITGCPVVIPCNCTTQTSAATNAPAAQSGKFDASLQVYPNPAKDKATVEFRVAEGQNYSVVIYDMVGRVVRNVSKGVGEANHTYQVPVNIGLEEGMYLVRLTTGNTVKSIRLNVQK